MLFGAATGPFSVSDASSNPAGQNSGDSSGGRVEAGVAAQVAEADRLWALGELPAAFQTIKQALALQPHSAEALRVLGKIFAAAGHAEEADAAYRASLELDPTGVGTWMGLGLLCRDRRQTGEARRCFEQAVSLRPDDPFLSATSPWCWATAARCPSRSASSSGPCDSIRRR